MLADGHARLLEESFKTVCMLRLWAGKFGVRVFFPALGSTQPSIQWVLGFFLGVK
jgi:hypothetical protein